MPINTLRKTLRTRGNRILIQVLVSAREKAGLTQRELATRLVRPHSFIGRIEAGTRRVDVVEFVDIAQAMETEPDELFVAFLKRLS